MPTFDLGRDPRLLQRVAAASGVNLINVTGWWLDVPRFLHGVGANQMADEFIRDLTEGFHGTDIKAGMLKCAADFEGVPPTGDYGARSRPSPPSNRGAHHGALLPHRSVSASPDPDL